MNEWDEYWKKYTTSKAEKWLIMERNKIINTYLDKLASLGSRGLINQRLKVIEVGCGYGSNTRLIKKNRNDVECYALDNSSVAIELIKEDIPNALLADCRATPFSDGKFDLIFSAGLMEHFRQEAPFLREMKRILKDSGYLITFVPAKYSLWQAYRVAHFGRWQHGYEKAYNYKSLKSVFIHNGFHVIKIMGIDPFSIQGFIMKLFNITFPPILRRSFIKSGYTELYVIAQKR